MINNRPMKPDRNNNQAVLQAMSSLIEEQKVTWDMCRNGYRSLEQVRTRTLQFGSYKVILQLNPQRIRSTGASIKPEAIEKRPCFLCAQNRPAEQIGIQWFENYDLLVNPFPIFSQHYTIVHKKHISQDLEGHLDSLLVITRHLSPHYSVIYNGPKSGASAPDHFHFQAIPVNITPVEHIRSFNRLTNEADFFNDGRTIIILKNSDKNALLSSLGQVLAVLSEIRKKNPEICLNCLSKFTNNNWQIFLFLRGKHRPDCYYQKGDKQYLISPGAIDMAGVIITPREEDYLRIQKNLVKQIYREVSLSVDEFDFFIEQFVKHT